MLKNTLLLASLFFIFTQLSHAQDLDIDVMEFCKDEDERCEGEGPDAQAKELLLTFMNGGQSSETEKKKTCESIKELAKMKAAPLEMKIDDDKGNKWKIRFHFGFTRTNVRPADISIDSTLVKNKIQGFEFDERTSAAHYNPKTWKNFQDAFRWIDEPSNTFTISIENKKNAFYVTAFHPKFLKTYYEIKDGNSTTYVPAPKDKYLSEGDEDSIGAIPDGQAGLEIQNTHMLMNYSLGYGRKFKIFDSKKAGKLTYIARVDAGVMVGAARSIYIEKGKSWTDERDKMRVQGLTGSLGNRLEYQRGKVGAFVEYKYNKLGPQEYKFLDGTAKSTGGDFSTINFGVSVDVLEMGRKNDKSKKKSEVKELNELEKIELNNT